MAAVESSARVQRRQQARDRLTNAVLGRSKLPMTFDEHVTILFAEPLGYDVKTVIDCGLGSFPV